MPQRDHGTVLVLDGQFMSALAICRSLGRRGIRVVLAGPDERPIARYSRYVSEYHRYPAPDEDTEGFLDSLATLAERVRPDLLIPVTEKTLIPIAEQRQRFEAICPVALPPADALQTVLDKQATAELARSLDIPVPQSLVAEDDQQLQQAAAQTGFPVAIKPIRSVSRKGEAIGPQLGVTYAFDADELSRAARPLLEHGAVVVQEYFRGTGGGIELIADHGRLAYAFQHRRLHEMPLSGGGSCLRESVAIDPQLLDASRRLVEALGWHGVAMVEFKWNPDSGEFRLIEINGRFWGSLPLSVAAGADFPWLAWRLHSQGQIPDIQPARPGVRCRDLGKDLYWHESVLRRVTDARLFDYPSKGVLLKGLFGLLSPKHRLDSWQWRDPRPGLAELGRIFNHYRERIGKLYAHRSELKRQARAWQSGEIRQRLADARQVLILCYGNINRSAAAHAYIEQRQLAPRGMQIRSAGFHPHGGRPADPNMVAAAAAAGIDLSHWQSSTVTEEMLNQADIIFAMEVAHLQRIAELSNAAAEKSFLWGGGLGETLEIADPYGQPGAQYHACLAQLMQAGDRLLDAD